MALSISTSSDPTFVQVPTYVFSAVAPHKNQLVLVGTYAALRSFRNNRNGDTHPTPDRIAERVGVSEKTIRRHLRTLKEIGLISWESMGLNNQNFYTFHEPPLRTRVSKPVRSTLSKPVRSPVSLGSDKSGISVRTTLSKELDKELNKELDRVVAEPPTPPVSFSDGEGQEGSQSSLFAAVAAVCEPGTLRKSATVITELQELAEDPDVGRERVIAVFAWASSHSYYADKLLSARGIRDHFRPALAKYAQAQRESSPRKATDAELDYNLRLSKYVATRTGEGISRSDAVAEFEAANSRPGELTVEEIIARDERHSKRQYTAKELRKRRYTPQELRELGGSLDVPKQESQPKPEQPVPEPKPAKGSSQSEPEPANDEDENWSAVEEYKRQCAEYQNRNTTPG